MNASIPGLTKHMQSLPRLFQLLFDYREISCRRVREGSRYNKVKPRDGRDQKRCEVGLKPLPPYEPAGRIKSCKNSRLGAFPISEGYIAVWLANELVCSPCFVDKGCRLRPESSQLLVQGGQEYRALFSPRKYAVHQSASTSGINYNGCLRRGEAGSPYQ